MLNQHSIIGYLGNDPEQHKFTNDNSITRFTVATSKKWKDKQSGETKTDTQWHNIVANGRYSSLTYEFLKKGSKVFIQGEVKHRSYGEANNKKYITETHLTNFAFLDKVERSTPLDNMPTKVNNTSQNNSEDDDLPF
ncbi:single-strand binding protein [Tenacibaculum sp. MAR_2009_124]|uniref:single-stranded DNA-binding protein n=1 Tax=Tenacibaculum sp. MAR_2009_124 TaxID=1250059 RepID=UPI0008955F07|nr:single-stranded DNA-binding protein [Tenacibaculum sp. MAR_2009_124]SED09501.1 single-strand binding protein [Tenacibaculum sp. MAR_2009_124]